MIVYVKWRVHRILRRLAQFHSAKGTVEQLPYSLDHLPLLPTETILGVYENEPESAKECLVVTDFALHVHRDGEWEALRYGEIANADFHPEKSGTTPHLGIQSIDRHQSLER